MAVIFQRNNVNIPVGTQTWETPGGVADDVTSLTFTIGMWPKAVRSLSAVFEIFDFGIYTWVELASFTLNGGGDRDALLVTTVLFPPGASRDVRIHTTVTGGPVGTSLLIESDNQPYVPQPKPPRPDD